MAFVDFELLLQIGGNWRVPDRQLLKPEDCRLSFLSRDFVHAAAVADTVPEVRELPEAPSECLLAKVRTTLTKRLVNHARPNDVTEGYAADWTITQLREPARKIANCIETLMHGTQAP